MSEKEYPLALPAGTILAGQYVIEKVLGEGGFGITYRAKDHKSGMYVAVKEFFPDTLAYRNMTEVVSYPGERTDHFEYGKEGFLQEAKTLAAFIGIDSIVRVYSYFEENNTAYFVMEYIEGENFEDFIKRNGGRITIDDAKRVLLPIMDALAAVHDKGIVHRDVTPDNIYITNDGKVKLIDFGAARYSLGDKSRSLDVILKHGFAPKEQYTRRGKQAAYTDIYSLGATFYYALTGKRPPDSVDRLEEDELIPPKNLGAVLSEAEENAILVALNVQPDERFQSMRAFKNAFIQIDMRNASRAKNMITFEAPPQAAPVQPVPVQPMTVQQPMPMQMPMQQPQTPAGDGVAQKAADQLAKFGGKLKGIGSAIATQAKQQAAKSHAQQPQPVQQPMPAPVPVQQPQPVQQPMPAPVPVQQPQQVQQPMPAPIPVQQPQQVQQPMPAPIPVQQPQPVQQPMPAPVPVQQPEFEPEPVSLQKPEIAAEEPEDIPATVFRPVSEPEPKPMSEPEPVIKPEAATAVSAENIAESPAEELPAKDKKEKKKRDKGQKNKSDANAGAAAAKPRSVGKTAAIAAIVGVLASSAVFAGIIFLPKLKSNPSGGDKPSAVTSAEGSKPSDTAPAGGSDSAALPAAADGSVSKATLKDLTIKYCGDTFTGIYDGDVGSTTNLPKGKGSFTGSCEGNGGTYRIVITDGDFDGDRLSGHATIKYIDPDGTTYVVESEYVNGYENGKGTQEVTYPAGDSEGKKYRVYDPCNFNNGKVDGECTQTTHYTNGDIISYQGNFKANYRDGKGVLSHEYASGEIKEESIEGTWTDGVLSGKVTDTMIYSNGDTKYYEGNYSNGYWNGEGTLTYYFAAGTDSLKREQQIAMGTWTNGLLDGYACSITNYYPDGSFDYYFGTAENGKIVSGNYYAYDSSGNCINETTF